jgi:predicted signal transduction protein with EAL and GGDEF domain
LAWIGVPLLVLANVGMLVRWWWRVRRVALQPKRTAATRRGSAHAIGPAHWRAQGAL